MYTRSSFLHITRHFSSSSLPPLKVAICGAGTVGGGVIEILSKRQDEVKGLRRTSSSFSWRKKTYYNSFVSHNLSYLISPFSSKKAHCNSLKHNVQMNPHDRTNDSHETHRRFGGVESFGERFEQEKRFRGDT